MTTWRRTMPTFLDDATDLYTLGAEYPQSVIDAGGLPVLLPQYDPDDALRVLEGFDGLVLVGGDDVDPASYGEVNVGVSKGTSATADASEQAFARAAFDLDIPIFAICRGFQLLNVAMGGTLHQDATEPGTAHPPVSSVPADTPLFVPIVQAGCSAGGSSGAGPEFAEAAARQARVAINELNYST